MATDFDFTPAERPTFYFIGMTTQQSSIMRVFPAWAEHLGLDCPIRGIDCEHHDDPAVYRRVVQFFRDDELSLGGLVTTHKLDLLKAARDLFDELGPYARQLEEISCISKRDGRLRGHAMDPITSGLSLDAFIDRDYWTRTGGDMCLLGAGGSSLAMTINIAGRPPAERPAAIHVTNRSEKRLAEMKAVHREMNVPIDIAYHLCPKPEQNDRVVAGLNTGSVIANATGLGKDAPGSPLTGEVVFPEDAIAWDFNYRGDLVFLDQAKAHAESRNVRTEDGWVYFIHGWTRVIAEVFDIEIPVAGPAFDELSRIAAEARTAS